MLRLFVLLVLAQTVLTVVALIDCLSAENGKIRALPRFTWVLIILFVPLVGVIAWFLTGRPMTAGDGRGGGQFPHRNRPRPPAPDDDPEFLRSLDAERLRRNRELLEHRELDPRHREDESSRDGADHPPRDDNGPQT